MEFSRAQLNELVRDIAAVSPPHRLNESRLCKAMSAATGAVMVMALALRCVFTCKINNDSCEVGEVPPKIFCVRKKQK